MARTFRSFAQVSADIGAHIPMDELIDLFAEADELVCNTSFDELELAYDCANQATFDRVVFKNCVFDSVDFSGCTFRDVLFSGCRFIRCNMERSWLNRCDFRDCSAPGLALVQSRLSSVSIASSDLSYANLSETSLGQVIAHASKFNEVALQRSKLKNIVFDDCELSRLDVFGTSLAGVDLSSCRFEAPVLSGDYHELRGCTVNVEQALALSGLLGIKINDN